MMEVLLTILASVLVALLAPEFRALCPIWAKALIVRAVTLLPLQVQRRYRTEWFAEIDYLEKHGSRLYMLLWACSVFRGARGTASVFRIPATKRDSFENEMERRDDAKPPISRHSMKEHLILQMLVDEGEMYGLEMVESSGGLLKRGKIYVTLHRMTELGYVKTRQVKKEGMSRYLYQVTSRGVQRLQAYGSARVTMTGGLSESPERGV